jgi:hypothetical protein
MTIVDTNVVSEIMRMVPSPRVLAWWSRHSVDGDLFITTISVAEILYGIELLPPGKRRAALLAAAEKAFGNVLGGRILAFDEESARIFPQIAVSRREQGRPIAEFDAQIAAIARSQGADLATRNAADFEGCGLHLSNPWLET